MKLGDGVFTLRETNDSGAWTICACRHGKLWAFELEGEGWPVVYGMLPYLMRDKPYTTGWNTDSVFQNPSVELIAPRQFLINEGFG